MSANLGSDTPSYGNNVYPSVRLGWDPFQALAGICTSLYPGSVVVVLNYPGSLTSLLIKAAVFTLVSS